LLHLNKVDHLEQLSCTDVEQVWGKRKAKVKETVEAVPLDEFCHCKINSATFNTSEDFKNKFVTDCLQAVQNSEATLHLGDRKSFHGDNSSLIRLFQQMILCGTSSLCNFNQIFSLVLLGCFCCFAFFCLFVSGTMNLSEMKLN
jgi:hypothetical protein